MAKLDQIIINGTTYEIVPEIAPLFDATKAYAVGDCVIKDAVLYRFTVAHAAGAWIGTDAEEVIVSEELTDLKADLTSLNTAINEITGNDIIAFTNGLYIETNVAVGSAVSLTPVAGAARNNYAIIDAVEGDRFTINGLGGNAGRLWAFVDASNLLISKAGQNITVENLVLTAPENAAKLILNVLDSPGLCFKGVAIFDEIKSLKYANDSDLDSIGLVKYSEFDQLLHLDKVPGASDSTVLELTRYGTVCVLDGGGCSSGIKFKMTGSGTGRTVNNYTVDNWTKPIVLEPGRTYIVTLHHLSGVQSVLPSINIYKTGEHATSGTVVVNTETEYVRRFVYDGTPIHIAVFVPANSTYENAKYNITLRKEAIDIDLASNTPFSEQYSYSIGDVVAHEGSLYVFTTTHTGAWDATHVSLVGEQKTVGYIDIPTGGVFNGYPGSGTFHSGVHRTVWARAYPNCRYFIARANKTDRFRVAFGNERPVNGGSYIANSVTIHDDNTSVAVTVPEDASYIFVYCTLDGSSYDADTVASWISLTAETDGDATAMLALEKVKNDVTGIKVATNAIVNDTNNVGRWEQGGIGSAGENYDERSTSIRTNEYLSLDQYISIATTSDYTNGFLALYSAPEKSAFIVRSVLATNTVVTVESIKSARPTATHFRIEIKGVDGDTDAYDQVQIVGINIPEPEQDSSVEDDLISQSRYIYAATDSGVSSKKPLTLLHFTDIHADLPGMKYVLETYNKYSSKIDAILHTGDAVKANFSNGITNWISSGCASVVLNTIGNHDTEENLVLQQAGKDNVYNAFFAPYISGWNVTQPTGVEDSTSPNYHALYYYKDFTTPGVRLIVLDTNWWDSAEKTWLSDVLNDALTNSLCVVIACHTVKKLTEMTESNFSSYTGNGINDTGNSYGNQPDDWLDPVQTFINSGGNFACILAGHNHSGHMGHMTNYPDIFVYVADKSSIARVSGTARNSGEINQNTVSIVTINPVEKLIKIVKIGAEVDGKMRGRHVFCYDYVNKRIVSQW